MLDAGVEPRQRLRYEPVLHEPERMEIAVKARLAMAFTNTVLEEGRKDLDAPTIKIIARFEATGVTATGATTISCIVESAEVLDDVVDVSTRRPVEALVAAMKGMHGTWNLSADGSVLAVAFDGPDVASGKLLPTLQELMLSSRLTFPDADLGIGARWQITRQQRLGGVTWEGGETYTLREVADATATVDFHTVMHAAPQALSVEPRATTKLTSGTGTVNASLTIPLHWLVPSGSYENHMEANLSIVNRDLRITTTLESHQVTSMRSLP